MVLAAAIAGCGKSGSDSQAPQATAATAPTPAEPPPPPPPPHKAVDLKAEKLSITTETGGHDVQKIALALEMLQVSKGPYESDADHKKRMAELGSKPLYDELKVNDLVALKAMNVRYHYDANKQQWEYEISSHSKGYEFNHFLIDERSVPTEPHIIEANYGRPINSYRTVTLQVPELKGLSYLQGNVKVPSAAAPQLQARLGVLFIGKLIPNYFSTFTLRQRDENRYEYGKTLQFKISSLWLINEETGEVLSKKWTKRTY